MMDFDHAIKELDLAYNELISLFGEENRDFFNTKCFMAGGAFITLLHKEIPNDYDFYCVDKEAIEKLEFLIWKKFKESVVRTENAMTIESPNLTQKFSPVNGPQMNVGRKFQFITFIQGTPQEVINTFDFQHCKVWYDPIKKYINFDNRHTKQCVDNKFLSYDINSVYPVAAMYRVIRFTKRGFKIKRDEILKILQCIKLYDLTDRDTLLEQVRGFYSSSKFQQDELVNTVLNATSDIKKAHAAKFKNDFKRTVNKEVDNEG